MDHPFNNASTPLNCTYDLEISPITQKTPRFTASTPELCDSPDLTSSPIKRAELISSVDINTDAVLPPNLIRTPDPNSLKKSLESHYQLSKNRSNNILSAPQSMHRGRIKDKTPQGSEERSRLLQALRSAQLERDEVAADYLVCSPFNENTRISRSIQRKLTRDSFHSDPFFTPNHATLTTIQLAHSNTLSAKAIQPFASVIRTNKYGGVRSHGPASTPLPDPARNKFKPALATPPNLCAEQPVTPFHSVIRTGKYGGHRERPKTVTSTGKCVFTTNHETALKNNDSTPLMCSRQPKKRRSNKRKVMFMDVI